MTGCKAGKRAVWHGTLRRQGIFADCAPTVAHVLIALSDTVSREAASALPCGGLTAFQALASALTSARNTGAGTDVFETQPPQNLPPLAAPNRVLSDRAAWYCEAVAGVLWRGAAEQAIRIVTTGTATERVN